MTTFTRALYGVLGVATLLGGPAILIAPQLILSPDVYTPLTAHLMREEASLFVFVGLMSFWCLRHYEARRPVHLAMLTFASLFAGVHVAGYLQHPDHIQGVVANVVPVVLLAVTAPWGKSAT